MHWQHPASVEDYLQELAPGRDGRQSLAVLFTDDKKDTGILEYMARLTVEGAELDDAEGIGPQGKVVPNAGHAHPGNDAKPLFPSGGSQHFQEEEPSPRKSLALRIVQWLFSTKENTGKVETLL